MNQYCVIYRKQERDDKLTVINALSLDEAVAIFRVRYKGYEEKMQEGEAIYIFQAGNGLKVDKNNRFIFPVGRMAIIHKWS